MDQDYSICEECGLTKVHALGCSKISPKAKAIQSEVLRQLAEDLERVQRKIKVMEARVYGN